MKTKNKYTEDQNEFESKKKKIKTEHKTESEYQSLSQGNLAETAGSVFNRDVALFSNSEEVVGRSPEYEVSSPENKLIKATTSSDSEKSIEEAHLSESVEKKSQESSVSSGTISKDREAIFEKAEEYIDKIYSDIYEVDAGEKDVTFAEYQKKLKIDMEEAGLAVERVCGWVAFPEDMNKTKCEQLEILIDKNNKGELSNESIIGFLVELYDDNYLFFRNSNFEGSWKDSLDYIHEESENPQLIGLVDELFS